VLACPISPIELLGHAQLRTAGLRGLSLSRCQETAEVHIRGSKHFEQMNTPVTGRSDREKRPLPQLH